MWQQHLLLGTSLVGAMCAALLLVLRALFFEPAERQNKRVWLMLYLAATCLGSTVIDFLCSAWTPDWSVHPTWCGIQGVLLLYLDTTTILLMVPMANAMFRSARGELGPEHVGEAFKKFKTKTLMFVMFLPAPMIVAPVAFNDNGYKNFEFRGSNASDTGRRLDWLCWLGPSYATIYDGIVTAVFVYIVSCYVRVAVQVARQKTARQSPSSPGAATASFKGDVAKERIWQEVAKEGVYPLLCVALYLGRILMRLYALGTTSKTTPPFLEAWATGGPPLLAVLSAAAFCYLEGLLARANGACKRWAWRRKQRLEWKRMTIGS